MCNDYEQHVSAAAYAEAIRRLELGDSSDAAAFAVTDDIKIALAIAAGLWAIVRAALWVRDIRLPRPLAYALPPSFRSPALMVTWTAYYGGQLVFDLGVNVATHAAS